MSKTKKSKNKGEASSKDTLRWTPEIDTMLLDALLEEAHKRNHPDGTFTSFAYMTVVKTLKPITRPSFQKQHIKNRMKILKDHFNECFDLFHAWSGIGWNPATQMFEAELEVWDEILKVKPTAQKWKRTLISNYDKLLELFGKDKDTGARAESARDKLQRWEKERIDLNDGFDVMSDSDIQWGSECPNMETCSLEYGTSNQSQGTSSSKGFKHKAIMADIVESGYEKMHIGINNLTDVLRERISIAGRQVQLAERGLAILESNRPWHYSEGEVWQELQNIGVMPEFRLKCYRILCENDKAKREFFGVPSEMRWDLLCQLMADAGLI